MQANDYRQIKSVQLKINTMGHLKYNYDYNKMVDFILDLLIQFLVHNAEH